MVLFRCNPNKNRLEINHETTHHNRGRKGKYSQFLSKLVRHNDSNSEEEEKYLDDQVEGFQAKGQGSN